MNLSIRSKLTLIITLVFASVFFLLISFGAFAVYYGVKNDIDQKLRVERDGMQALFDSDFSELLNSSGAERTRLTNNFLSELNRIHGYKNQFVVFRLEKEKERRVYSEGGIRNLQLILPKSLLDKPAGFHNQRLDARLYRVLVAKPDWGTLIVGIENQAYNEVGQEFREVLFISVPLTLFLVLAGGRFLAKQVMKPVLEAAQKSEKITLTNLGARLPVYKGNDEFGNLVETLNRMISRLEDGVNQIQQFTQDAAHELRTPLTTIRGELELAFQETNISSQTAVSIQKALDKTISMSQIVDNLILLAQSDSGEYPIKVKVFRLDELVADLVDDLKLLTENRDLEIKSSCENITLSGDKQLVHRLLLNLADNAVKYTKKGTIELKLTQIDHQISVTLSDTGEGIPEQNLKNIFKRFYRGEEGRVEKIKGSGLGLAICKWIVEAHNGQIEIDSKINIGTIVTVTLPKTY